MIKDLKDFEKMLKICRKQGVLEVSVGDLSVKFGDLPSQKEQEAQDSEIPTDELMPEQLAFYAVNSQ